MYLVIDKRSKTILHMSNSFPGEEKAAKDVFPEFDPVTMDFGRSPEQYVPTEFAIENGVVKNLAALTASVNLVESIDQARQRKLAQFSDASFAARRELIPDHELINAALGIYDAERVQSIRRTVEAFRNEYHRLAAAVGKAGSPGELEAIKASFPKSVVQPVVGGAAPNTVGAQIVLRAKS